MVNCPVCGGDGFEIEYDEDDVAAEELVCRFCDGYGEVHESEYDSWIRAFQEYDDGTLDEW